MDEGIGNISDALVAKGIWGASAVARAANAGFFLYLFMRLFAPSICTLRADEALLIFMADNGAPTGPGGCGNNFPLRGGKTSDFEGGAFQTTCRILCFLSW
jgi:hypothetical protein